MSKEPNYKQLRKDPLRDLTDSWGSYNNGLYHSDEELTEIEYNRTKE